MRNISVSSMGYIAAVAARILVAFAFQGRRTSGVDLLLLLLPSPDLKEKTRVQLAFVIGDRGQNARAGVGGWAGHEHIDEYHYELTPIVVVAVAPPISKYMKQND